MADAKLLAQIDFYHQFHYCELRHRIAESEGSTWVLIGVVFLMFGSEPVHLWMALILLVAGFYVRLVSYKRYKAFLKKVEADIKADELQS